jgi:hypothetical protein
VSPHLGGHRTLPKLIAAAQIYNLLVLHINTVMFLFLLFLIFSDLINLVDNELALGMNIFILREVVSKRLLCLIHHLHVHDLTANSLQRLPMLTCKFRGFCPLFAMPLPLNTHPNERLTLRFAFITCVQSLSIWYRVLRVGINLWHQNSISHDP